MVQVLTAKLAAIKAELSLTDDVFLQFLEDERDYLNGLKQLLLRDQLPIHYVEVLNELAK